jgi:hypothetical protein
MWLFFVSITLLLGVCYVRFFLVSLWWLRMQHPW